MLTGVLFGLAPSLVASRADLTLGLREGGRGSVGGAGRLRAGLVAAEMALSVILLAGAGLLFRSLVGLQGVDPGLNPAHMLTFRVQIPPARYRTPADRTQFFTRALEQLERLPGVESASAISYLPFNGMAAGTDLAIAGRPPTKPGAAPVATIRTVMPEYFRTVGIPLRKGRAFTAADNAPDSPYRFVVNQAFVEKYLAGEEPLGQQVSVDMDDRNPFGEIIGVVALVLGSGMRVVLSGAIVGTGGALALTGLLKSLLFGVQAQDPATFALVPAVLIAVALLSAYLPARRASRLAPVEALKLE
jgi:putative ABC transport system permease protein